MRQRLTWAITLVSVASVALFALPLAVIVSRSYRDEERLRLERDTIAATRRVDIAAQPSDRVDFRVPATAWRFTGVMDDDSPARARSSRRSAAKRQRAGAPAEPRAGLKRETSSFPCFGPYEIPSRVRAEMGTAS